MNKEEQLTKDRIVEDYYKARKEYRVGEWLKVILSNGSILERHFVEDVIDEHSKDMRKELKTMAIEDRLNYINEERMVYNGRNS